MVAVRFLPPTPPWLQKLLKKNFYNEENKCRIHKSQYETFFCKDCMSEFFCQICAKDIINRDHENHTIVKVVICSGQASVNIVEFQEIWSIKDIQPYKINGKNVVYLRIDKQGITSPDNGCRTCQRRLLDHDTYKYCSIKCQIKSDKYRNGGRMESNLIEVNDVVPVPVPAATPSPPWRREDKQQANATPSPPWRREDKQQANAGRAKIKKRRRWSQSRSQWHTPKTKRNDQKRRRTDEPPPPVTVINRVAAIVTVNIGAMVVKKSRRKQSTPHRAPLK